MLWLLAVGLVILLTFRFLFLRAHAGPAVLGQAPPSMGKAVYIPRGSGMSTRATEDG